MSKQCFVIPTGGNRRHLIEVIVNENCLRGNSLITQMINLPEGKSIKAFKFPSDVIESLIKNRHHFGHEFRVFSQSPDSPLAVERTLN